MIEAPVGDVGVTTYVVPTDAPEADGTIAWDSTTVVLVRVSAGDRTGTGWTYGSAACATVVARTLGPLVRGRSALDIGGIHESLVRAVRNDGRPGVVSCAISALDVALWDLKARLLDLPLHHLLGAVRDQVPVYGSGGFTTYDHDRLAAQLTRWRHELDIPRVKIKVAESWGADTRRDLARMGQARACIGDDAELFVDANGGYSRKQAVRVAREAADAGVTWFEEPVSSDDLDGLHEVRSAVDADVTAGEYGFDLPYFWRMCSAGAVDCVQADVSRCGGITEWLRVAALAAGFGLDVSGHCGPHLHAHVGAAVPNLRHLEWFHDHVRIEGLLFDGTLDPTGGTVAPHDDRPGLGLTLRVADARRFEVGG